MSRSMTLEEYLERFVDENTQSAQESTTLLLSDAQAQTLGLFLMSGLAGYLERIRIDRGESQMSATTESDQDGRPLDESDQEDFIN
jgi:hypothetical protein